MILTDHGPRVIADTEIPLRERSIAELLAGSPQLVELLVDGDYSQLAGHTIRRATTVADLCGEVTR